MRCGIGLWTSLVILLALASPARADRTWLPEKGQLNVSPIFVYETFDEFYMNETRTDYPPGRYKQITALVAVEYGLLDGISLDLTMGYVRAFGDPVVNDGLYDTTIGINFSILDGSLFTNAIGTLQPGEERSVVVHPRGESQVRLTFETGGQKIDSGGLEYFEESSMYRVSLTVTTNLQVESSSTIKHY